MPECEILIVLREKLSMLYVFTAHLSAQGSMTDIEDLKCIIQQRRSEWQHGHRS